MNKILLTTAALALVASSAFAKDAASGDNFYVKGSIGTSFGKEKNSITDTKLTGTKSYSRSAKGTNVIGGAALGASFSNGFRTELEFLINNGSKKLKSSSDNLTAKVKDDTYATLVNAYFDFKNNSNLTPFVTAGLGWAKTKHSFSYEKSGYSKKIKPKSKSSLAYKIGAGVGFKASKNITLDLSYSYMNTGAKFSYNKDNVSYKAKSSGTHAIMTGVRFAF